ncbi:Clp protease N-terminal domain-containing protein [Cellulomonas sp. RIT-PI-Y]|uniref:Clp protease N-terminal domain-containing protein n=1 Tax=Cellulomonas sp. RIT-PI-Y TaxID=3035297 RepID=UPI0021DB4A91|nr:Clp protease N-terminal domain-containing protein [Cellulomonas sp. RIT-PI-Y]
MFERFTADARTTVTEAQARARDLGADRIDGTHLLLALSAGGGPAGAALAAAGITPDRLTALIGSSGLDAEALAAIGIDLDAVRAGADHTFGAGALDRAGRRSPRHLTFDREAKKTLEVGLREAVRLGDRSIDSGHLLLAVLRLPGSAAHALLLRAGGDPERLRTALESRPAA